MGKPFLAAFALMLAAACTPIGANNATLAANRAAPANQASASGPLQLPPAGGLPIAPAGAPAGLVGGYLGAVQQSSDFFTFFHLAPTGPESAPGVIDFRLTASAFQAVVDVSVTIDQQGRITAMTLTIARSFIDDPSNGPFARDLAKTFLREAPPAVDAQAVAGLATDIDQSARTGPSFVAQTPYYAVFAGTNPGPVNGNLTASQFAMTQASENGAPALALSFTAH